MTSFIELISNYTVQIVLLGAMVLGVSSGALGTFALLRRHSLLGDAISHAALPGVCLAFLLTQSKSPLILLLGAGFSGWLGVVIISWVTENSRIKKDTALGIVLSVFFGFGLVLLTMVQKLPGANKAGLDTYLFGNAATLLREDVIVMAVSGGLILLILFAFWKEFKSIVFDRDFAESIGLNVPFLDILLSTLIVVAIVLGLQTVGVILMSAMLVAPAAAARQWTDRLGVMVALSAFFGALSGVSGALTSSLFLKLPTGPTIVLYLSAFVFVSLFFAPHRGLMWDGIRLYRNKSRIRRTAVLKNLMLFTESHTDPFHPHDVAALNAIGRGPLDKTMETLSREGLVHQSAPQQWALTPQGLEAARRLTREMEDQIDDRASN